MSGVAPALHRAILCVDIEGFGDRRRTNLHQVAVRDGLYRSLRDAFTRSGVEWAACYHEDRGDGALILVSPDVPKNLLAERVPRELASALSEHNRAHNIEARIRLRMAVHAGEVHSDAHGVVGAAINVAFRLLEADELKRALKASAGTLAVIASEWFFDEVIRHDPASDPTAYRQVQVPVKETQTSAWVYVPGAAEARAVSAELDALTEERVNPNPMHLAVVDSTVGNTNLGVTIESRNLIVHGSVVAGRDSANLQSPDRLDTKRLPRESQPFVGRVQVVARLESLLRSRDRAAAPIVLITGMGGSGKSAIAAHLARKVADEYPDGQVYVSLERSGDAAHHASEILGEVLGNLGLQVDAIPDSLHVRAALYRSLLARRKVLVVLDGATDTRQIRPLLSPGASSAVIVTSRSQMSALGDATHVRVGALSAEESVQLLARIAGPRVTAEPDAALRLAAACAHLPLALSLVAAPLASQPDLAVSDLVDRLMGKRQELDDSTSGGRSLKAVLDWSYRHLDEAHARAFRLLSLVPGTTFDPEAAAAVLDSSSEAAGRLLESLAAAHLLGEQSGRYRYHDLLRTYAREASEQDSQEDKAAALARVRQWYLDRVSETVGVLSLISGNPTSGQLSRTEAVGWLETERGNLLALINDAAQAADFEFVWRLADLLYPFYQLGGYWADSQAIHETALNAARTARNHSMAGRILNNLGVAYREQRHYDEAISCFEESLAITDSAASASTRDLTLMNLGVAYRELGQLSDAISCFEAALTLADEANRPRTTGLALSNLGNVYRDMGRYQDALTAYQQGLRASRSVDDRYGEGIAIMNLGLLHHRQGLWGEAVTHYLESLAITREVGDRLSEGRVLRNLGSAAAAQGAIAEAIAEFEDSLRVARAVGDTETIYLATLELGDIELKRGHRRSAMEWYRECHAAARTLGDPGKEAQVIARFAADSESSGDTEIALAYWRGAAEAFREGSDQPGVASALIKNGTVLAALHRPEEAVACYEESAAICRDIGDVAGELAALTPLVTVYGDLGQLADAAAASRRVTEIRHALQAGQ